VDYQNYSRNKGWAADAFGECPPSLHHYYKVELARAGFSCSGRRVLELGFGNGSFLSFARASGAEAIGVELQPELVERARARGFVAYPSLDKLLEQEAPHSIDLAVALDVLEHLSSDEAVELLRKLARLLVPGTGLLLSRFPNGDSPFSLPYQNGDVTHRTALGYGAVQQIMAQADWRLLYLGEPALASLTLRDRLKNLVKLTARRAIELPLMQLYYGSGRPSTWFWNYLMVAQPSAASARE
jgi:SAM-dependent methyltransferase